ncbi:MAG TPA: hypothetical protein VHB74_11960 [Devosia sp.]|nr:hypothetical protein [Devosia sp.]
MFERTRNGFLLVLVALMAAASPASAQLIHRNHDGGLSFDPLMCQTDYQIRQIFAAKGYTHITLSAPLESVIRVRASKGNRLYLIDYNYCLGRIDGITPLPIR